MFEKFLHQTPFVKFLLPLIAGILLKVNTPTININLLYPIISLLILIIVLHFFNYPNRFIGNRIWSFFIFIILINCGALLVQIKEKSIYNYKNQQYNIIATVTEPPVEKEKTIKTQLTITAIQDSPGWINNNNKILAYFEKDSSTQGIKLGDKIITKTYINNIKHSGNPYAFNYKKYLKYKDIDYQVYIKKNQFKTIGNNCGPPIILFSNKLRQKLLRIYESNNIIGDEFAVLSALTLGYKTELTPELKESFSTSGAMHILAVSGLHVGILFIIISKLLFFLDKRKYSKLFQSIITISILFFYATITGLSSSVIRATIMFSFICIGRTFTRQSNIYNSISASAFIMLLYNPYSLMDVGFQLSYLAVISIVFFQAKIYSLLSIKNKIGDYIWQLISVAIAAQIGTFPITIHYFEQFPIYFILSNILIIPLVSIIIYGAIILFLFSFSHQISIYVAKGLNFITWLLNTNVEFIENLPFSKIENLTIDKVELFSFILTILLLSFFILKKQIQYIRYILYCSIFLLSYNIFITIKNAQKSLFVVYNIPKSTAFNFISHKQSHLANNFSSDNFSKNLEYNVKPLLNKLNITNLSYSTPKDSALFFNHYQFLNKRIIQINNHKISGFKNKEKLAVDFIILSENTNIKITKLSKLFDFKYLIFDSSNSFYINKQWEEECKKLKLNYHSVVNNGAFILEI